MARPNLENERIGIKSNNHFGSLMEVVVYKTVKDVWVKFEQGNLVHVSWDQFCKGNVRNPFDKSIYGIGYLGEGKHKAYINSKNCTPEYRSWYSMMNRCYSKKYQEKQPSYKDCIVCDDWHNFQNFAKWYDDNYYEAMGDKMCLDKDILVKGNKIYSPDTCIFVAQNINKLFTKRENDRGNLPIGVYSLKGKYKAQITDGKGKRICLGVFNNPEEAFNAYKYHKEKVIKQLAEEYKNRIPKKLYDAMTSYEVEITD